MEWRDQGIVLGTRRHGETSVILEVMTAAHGRHLGLVRGGRSRRLQPVLQAGNRVELTWRARLDEHLGNFQVEPVALNAARLMNSALSVYGIQTLAAHLRLLAERDPQPDFFETLGFMIEHLDEAHTAGVMLARFEVAVLEELGFGLDLSHCALTGQRDGLAYVSPKSGRAVTREAGEPWQDKLFALPAFLLAKEDVPRERTDIQDAFALTGFFLHRHVYEPRGLMEPEARAGFLAALRRGLTQAASEADGDSAA